MLGVLGAMAALDRPHVDAFEIVRPGIDVDAELARWRADDPDGLRENFDADDLYGDVRDVLRRAARGRAPGDHRRQPAAAGAGGAARRWTLGVDADPDLRRARRRRSRRRRSSPPSSTPPASRPSAIAYVGDRLDNDVLPARRAGMRTVLLRPRAVGLPPRRAARRRARRRRRRTRSPSSPALLGAARRAATGGVERRRSSSSTARATRSTVSSRQRRPTICRPIGRPACSAAACVPARHGDRRARRHEVEHGGHVGGVVARRRPSGGIDGRSALAAGHGGHGHRRAQQGVVVGEDRRPGAATGRCGWISMRL